MALGLQPRKIKTTRRGVIVGIAKPNIYSFTEQSMR
jgi:hypothetical protein